MQVLRQTRYVYLMPILYCKGNIFIIFLFKEKKHKKILIVNAMVISKDNLFSEHGSGGYSIPPEHY